MPKSSRPSSLARVGEIFQLGYATRFRQQSIALGGSWSVPLAPLGLPVNLPMLLVLGEVGLVGNALALRAFTRRDLPAPL